MQHLTFVGRRLLQSIPVLVGVTLVVFLLIHFVPGDPALSALGVRATPEAIESLRTEWGLDRSLPAQYTEFLGRLVTGDLGTSLRFDRPAGTMVMERLPVTVWLIVYAAILSVLISVPLALWAASRPGAARDGVVRILSVAGLGIPGFWLGLILLEFVAIKGQLFPSGGVEPGLTGHLESLFLPSLTIASGIVPLVTRSLRAEILKVAEADYVTTARAKGLTELRIRLRHVLRNALGPSVTVLAVHISFLVGGTLVVEGVFGLGGAGQLMLTAIEGRDFQVVQATTLILAFIVVLVNIGSDVVQALLDPRVESR